MLLSNNETWICIDCMLQCQFFYSAIYIYRTFAYIYIMLYIYHIYIYIYINTLSCNFYMLPLVQIVNMLKTLSLGLKLEASQREYKI